MKKTVILASAIIALSFNSNAQTYYRGNDGSSFHKGSLLVSASEGGTYTHYTTTTTEGTAVKQGNENGDRDPLTIEYGLSRHWGVGINMGGDLFNVNSNKYYNYNGEMAQKTKVITSEVTADVHYHFFVTHHTDLSAFVSFGFAGMNIEGGSGETKYKYTANGGIARGGFEGRYYVTKRFGFLAMISGYSSRLSTKDVKDNTFGNNITTGINGFAWELGMCVRFRK